MVKHIIQIGDPILYKKSKRVDPKDIFSRENRELIKDMLDTLNSDPDSSAGLSAIQIGQAKQIYVIRRIDFEEDTDSKPVWEVVINPKVTKASKDQSFMWEGCLSVGTDENRLFAPVARAEEVEIEYLNEKGEPKTLKADGYLAHIIMHEQDHLDGVLFLKYITSPENIWTGKRLDDYIQEHGKYPPINL